MSCKQTLFSTNSGLILHIQWLMTCHCELFLIGNLTFWWNITTITTSYYTLVYCSLRLDTITPSIFTSMKSLLLFVWIFIISHFTSIKKQITGLTSVAEEFYTDRFINGWKIVLSRRRTKITEKSLIWTYGQPVIGLVLALCFGSSLTYNYNGL